jgi:hypothetical protein
MVSATGVVQFSEFDRFSRLFFTVSTHFRAEIVLQVYAAPIGIFELRMTLVRKIPLFLATRGAQMPSNRRGQSALSPEEKSQ